MKRNLYILNILLTILLIAIMVGLLCFGTEVLFVLAYMAIFIFVTSRTLVTTAKKRVRAYLIISYFFVMCLQIVIAVQVIFQGDYAQTEALLRRLFGVLVMLLPLLVSRFISKGNYTQFYLPSMQGMTTISFAAVKNNSKRIVNALGQFEHMGKSLSPDNIKTIVEDLPRHDSFRYINNGHLTDAYFADAAKNLTDPFLYLIISNTGSAASEMISVFTHKQYNHASLSFDRDLKTIISYNGGERVYPPGLNHEMLEFFNKKPDASILVYRLPCTRKQKELILQKVEKINREGSAYNMIGLVLKYSHKPNIMFCSQFVYRMLQLAGLAYFEKKAGTVKPTDFIELDYHRNLQFEYEVKLNAIPKKEVARLPKEVV